MEKQVVITHENQLLEDVVMVMLKHDIGCLPVNQHNEVVSVMENPV